MKLTAPIGALFVAATLAASPALAQQASPQTGGEGVQLQAKSLMGSTVRSQDGKDIGKVSNLMVDKDGKITSVVVTMGGKLGMGGQDVAVPWDSVQVGRDQQSLVVTMDPSQLPQAPAKQSDRGDKQQQDNKKQQ
jgi:sporulation protein YlmC with PRC-barrel domain